MKKKFYLSFLLVVTLISLTSENFGQRPDLGTVANFALFTPVGAVGSTGISTITGKVGTNDGAITGFDPLFNEMHNSDALSEQCSIDILIAYNQLNDEVATIFPISLLGNGQVLYPGVYSISEASTLDGSLTFDAQGNSNAIFVIQIQGAFSTTASSVVHLSNGALALNIFWKVEGAVAMAAESTVKGTFIANNGAFSMAAGGELEGRGLSTTGAISINGAMVYTAPVSLPVTLIDFKATKSYNVIELLWTTVNEFYLESYELERSADGRNFYNIGSVPATNTSSVKTYSWMDKDPLTAECFYRLRMLDIDQVFKYSAVVRINMYANKGISVYPNPVTDHLIILQMYGQLKGDHIISLYNTTGEKVMSNRIIHSGNDAVRSIALNKNLPRAVYYLEIMDPAKNKQTLAILIN